MCRGGKDTDDEMELGRRALKCSARQPIAAILLFRSLLKMVCSFRQQRCNTDRPDNCGRRVPGSDVVQLTYAPRRWRPAALRVSYPWLSLALKHNPRASHDIDRKGIAFTQHAAKLLHAHRSDVDLGRSRLLHLCQSAQYALASLTRLLQHQYVDITGCAGGTLRKGAKDARVGHLCNTHKGLPKRAHQHTLLPEQGEERLQPYILRTMQRTTICKTG
jgi:hypothetical protein